MLCDAATIREGLLHVLGAGITGTAIERFPASLSMALAVRLVLESRELRDEHTLHVRLTTPQDEQLGSIQISFIARGLQEPNAEGAIAAPVPLSGFIIPRAGMYLIGVKLDRTAAVTLPLRVEQAEGEASSSPSPD
ncbi:MAG TPA: hypothetical protein DGB72_06995 [Gemmatimonadetes bacterium]|nr:hypothetical protein [Gemmatimonadota bacterium]